MGTYVLLGAGHHVVQPRRSGGRALYSWGSYGKLGHGDEEDQLLPKRVEAMQKRVCSVVADQHHSLAVTQSGAFPRPSPFIR